MSFALDEARGFAREHGWSEIDHQENICMVSFRRGTARLNFYYSKSTVGTVVDHPRYGRNQMFRKNVWGENLRAVFADPRVHLNRKGVRGYHQDGRHISRIKRGEIK